MRQSKLLRLTLILDTRQNTREESFNISLFVLIQGHTLSVHIELAVFQRSSKKVHLGNIVHEHEELPTTAFQKLKEKSEKQNFTYLPHLGIS